MLSRALCISLQSADSLQVVEAATGRTGVPISEGKKLQVQALLVMKPSQGNFSVEL